MLIFWIQFIIFLEKHSEEKKERTKGIHSGGIGFACRVGGDCFRGAFKNSKT